MMTVVGSERQSERIRVALRRLRAAGEVFRTRDAVAVGITRAELARLANQGALEHLDRGLYRFADAAISEHASLVEVAKRAPSAIICLLSALQFHGLTTELPAAVWLMVDTHRRPPKITTPRIEVVRASGEAFEHGVMTRRLEGVDVRITTPAKTVADCFRYRKYVGLEVAIEALRDFVAQSKKRRGPAYSVDALMNAAKVDNVVGVVRPYLEALV
jgi:predicted transcriptional regulator of viral defense system